MTTSTRSANIDTWVNEARAADTHGPDANLLISAGSGTRRYAYVYCQRPWADSRGVTVISAYLDLFLTRAAPATGAQLNARRVTGSWSEGTAKWSKRPTVDPAVVATVPIPGGVVVGTRIRLDLTALFQNVVSGAPYYGVELSIDPAAGSWGPARVASSEYPTLGLRPLLTVEWASAPDEPADLRPGAGRFVSTARPVLAWSFGDVRDASAYQTAYRVQIAPDDTFAAPEFDTDQTSSGSSQVDLAATVYAGLPADGSTRYWRAMVWDDSGTQSAWSDPVAVRYWGLGAVVITAPPATTSDIRPVVAWTFTPEPGAPAGFSQPVQAAWRVVLERLDGTVWTLLADSGLVTGTDTQWAPPVALSKLGARYRATVSVADSLDREGLPTAPAQARAQTTFQIVPSGTVTDPAGLTATVTDGYAVRLDWTRATRPDHWALEVNGQVLADGIDVEPVGTAYAWTYYGVLPRKTTDLKLHAVEVIGGANVLSAGATVTVTTDPVGIWLVDQSTGQAIHLADREALDAELGETSAVYNRLGERAPVLVTEIVRGMEGGVSGALLDWDGQDARAAKAAVMALREYGVDLRLILGDLNLPVAIYGLAPVPTPAVGDSRFDVAFSFIQTAEFDR